MWILPGSVLWSPKILLSIFMSWNHCALVWFGRHWMRLLQFSPFLSFLFFSFQFLHAQRREIGVENQTISPGFHQERRNFNSEEQEIIQKEAAGGDGNRKTEETFSSWLAPPSVVVSRFFSPLLVDRRTNVTPNISAIVKLKHDLNPGFIFRFIFKFSEAAAAGLEISARLNWRKREKRELSRVSLVGERENEISGIKIEYRWQGAKSEARTQAESAENGGRGGGKIK